MSDQSDHVEIILEKPNKRAIASLIIGFFLLFPAFIFAQLFFVFPLLLFVCAGIGIIYGAINIIIGNHATKMSAKTALKTALKNIGLGAITGIITGFLLIIIFQFAVIGKYWDVWLLIWAIPWAITIGLFAGGIGGLILGSTWKHPKAALIGGGVAITILSPGIFLLSSSCVLLGGC